MKDFANELESLAQKFNYSSEPECVALLQKLKKELTRQHPSSSLSVLKDSSSQIEYVQRMRKVFQASFKFLQPFLNAFERLPSNFDCFKMSSYN